MGYLKAIRFVRKIGSAQRGYLCTPTAKFACAIGRSGLKRDKREGDGATPLYPLALRKLYYRGMRPRTGLKAIKIQPNMAWCDAADNTNYNRLIKREKPHEESLFRQDKLYDVVIVLGWNDAPVRKGKGSAIFWHIARENFSPTAGCYATTIYSLKLLLPRMGKQTRIMLSP